MIYMRSIDNPTFSNKTRALVRILKGMFHIWNYILSSVLTVLSDFQSMDGWQINCLFFCASFLMEHQYTWRQWLSLLSPRHVDLRLFFLKHLLNQQDYVLIQQL